MRSGADIAMSTVKSAPKVYVDSSSYRTRIDIVVDQVNTHSKSIVADILSISEGSGRKARPYLFWW